jgi:hypothetical protein
LGDKERAFQFLQCSIADRSDGMPWLNVDPRLDPLRSDPRFNDLLRQVGFAPRRATQFRRERLSGSPEAIPSAPPS